MRKIDFTNLIDELDDTSLIDPELQPNHPLMQRLFEVLAYNLMDPSEQQLFDQYIYNGSNINADAAFRTLGEQVGGSNHDAAEILDTLYTGLMNDIQYQGFQDEKENNPKMTARAYYNHYVKQYASPGMNKLAAVFDAFLSEKPQEKPVKFISKEEFTAMSPEDRKKNYDRAVQSIKRWK